MTLSKYLLLRIGVLLALSAPAARGQGRAADGTWGFVNARIRRQRPRLVPAGPVPAAARA